MTLFRHSSNHPLQAPDGRPDPEPTVPAGIEVPRRRLMATAAVAGAAAALGTAAPAVAAPQTSNDPDPAGSGSNDGTQLILLGTAAGPVPFRGRTGIASALVVDGQTYLVDLGHGAFDQFQKAGLHPDSVRDIFITHLHSDHLADLYTYAWLRFGGDDPITQPLHLYGPGSAGELPDSPKRPVVNPSDPVPGLADFVDRSIQATAYDINLRMRDEGWPDIRRMLNVHEIKLPAVGASANGTLAPPMDPFPVFSDDKVRVTAILVEHPPVFPSFAFRFDTDAGSVVFSGDTTITNNMITLAKDADVLVHEVIDLQVVAKQNNLSQAQLQHLGNSHTDVTKVGRIAQQAGVKRLVLSHLAPGTKAIPDAQWQRKASRGFHGEVVVGDNLERLRL